MSCLSSGPVPVPNSYVSPLQCPLPRCRKLKSATQIAFRWSIPKVQHSTFHAQRGILIETRRVVDNWFVFMCAVRCCSLVDANQYRTNQDQHVALNPLPVTRYPLPGTRNRPDAPWPCKMPFDCDLKTLTWWLSKFHGLHKFKFKSIFPPLLRRLFWPEIEAKMLLYSEHFRIYLNCSLLL